MHRNLLISIVWAALVSLASAAIGEPARKPVLVSPEFSGTFFAYGHPATGAEVRVGFSGDHDHPCSGLPVVAVVDASGRFFASAKEIQMSRKELEAVPYHSFQNYICFSYKGEELVDSMFVTFPSDPYKYIGTCKTPHTSGYDQGMCKWRKEHA